MRKAFISSRGFEPPTINLRFEAPGFTPAEKTLSLLVGQELTVDVTMRPASTSSTVDVLGGADLIEASSSQVGGNINPTQVATLPLNGRNWMELTTALARCRPQRCGLHAPGRRQHWQVSDQRRRPAGDAETRLIKASANRSTAAMRWTSFRSSPTGFDATLGRSAQLQINAQTKAGTNAYHGTAYGYFRSDSFNAADPIARKVSAIFRQAVRWYVSAGAIIKDKLWFFGAYEGEKQPSTLFLVPIGFGGQTFQLCLAADHEQLPVANRLADFKRQPAVDPGHWLHLGEPVHRSIRHSTPLARLGSYAYGLRRVSAPGRKRTPASSMK